MDESNILRGASSGAGHTPLIWCVGSDLKWLESPDYKIRKKISRDRYVKCVSVSIIIISSYTNTRVIGNESNTSVTI